MGRIRIIAFSMLIVFLALTLTPKKVKAEENQMKAVFMDTFYGMATGVLLASAVSLTQHEPNWGANVSAGAAIGGIAGALFGIATEVRYSASVEDGKLTLNIPSISANVEKKEPDTLIYTAGIFHYTF